MIRLTWEKDDKWEEQKRIDEAIRQAFNVDNPEFAYICGGLRRISVNPKDRRVRTILLRKGIRYYSSVQFFIYCCIHCLPVDVFLDIGSNYGECLFALPLYAKVKVRGYEANAGLMKYLHKSRLYNDDIKDIAVARCAVAGRAGEKLSFYIDTEWSGKSSVLLGKKRNNVFRVEVPTTSIDDEVDRIGGCRLLLVKVDVEGFEPQVMEGAARVNRELDNIIYLLEFDSKYLKRGGVEPKEFFNQLAGQFKVYKLSSRRIAPVADIDHLLAQQEFAPRIHVDLVLTKFGESQISDAFEQKIAAKDLKAMSESLWEL
jgi:FkbM family methyltransferase